MKLLLILLITGLAVAAVSGSESGAVTTNEMTMSTESGSDLDSEDIPYETDENESKEGEPLTPEVLESIDHPEEPIVVEDIEDHAIDGEIVQIVKRAEAIPMPAEDEVDII
ncbi:hypothetical protein ACHWQZ_G001348 [Mnemiopsis leidyi]